MQKAMKIHTGIVNDIDKRLRNKKDVDGSRYYMSVAKEIEYGKCYNNNHNAEGEIDNFAIRHGKNNRTYLLFFEVKYKYHLSGKAQRQLDREESRIERIIKKHHINHDNVRVFKLKGLGYGTKDCKYSIEWYR